MSRFRIALTVLVASIALFAAMRTAAFAETLETPHPHRSALRRVPPEWIGDSSSGQSAFTVDVPMGVGAWRGYAESKNAPAVDTRGEVQEMRALIRLVRWKASADKLGSSLPGFTVPSLSEFIAQVKTNQSGVLTGVYVPGTLALRVVTPRATDPLYVTIQLDAVTNSCGTSICPSTGLLAHNQLSGALFFRLSPNQEVDLVFGDGSIHRYRITSLRHFQALSPLDPYSSLVDLDSHGAPLSSTDVFNQIYGVARRVVFQTCISANGQLTWGRLFVIADRI